MDKDMSCEEILKEFHNQCSRTCKKDGTCIKYIQLYLDNMACKREDAYFLEGTKNCKPCSEYYKLHNCIKENIKEKCSQISLPEDLESTIIKSIENIKLDS